MLLDISSGFIRNAKHFVYADFFLSVSQYHDLKITANTHVHNFPESFSNVAKTFIVTRSRKSLIMGVLPH